MRRISEVEDELSLEGEVLRSWIEQRWIRPTMDDGEPLFDEADMARARLIAELRQDFNVSDDAGGPEAAGPSLCAAQGAERSDPGDQILPAGRPGCHLQQAEIAREWHENRPAALTNCLISVGCPDVVKV
jgi:hypothetical protein